MFMLHKPLPLKRTIICIKYTLKRDKIDIYLKRDNTLWKAYRDIIVVAYIVTRRTSKA